MRGGRYETLRLPLDDEAAEGSSTSNSHLVRPQNPNARRPGSIHQQAKPYVRSLTQLVKFKTIKEKNAVIGYTLHPGSDPVFFERAGLQDGDTLTSINGINVNTGTDLFRGLQSTKDGKPVTLYILRNSQEKKLTFKLP
jgi:general secretion pathway protein C